MSYQRRTSVYRSNTRSFCLIASLCSAATVIPVARASDHFVCAQGCAFVTVQSAVDSSAQGDTIHIGQGTYFENVLISKRLTLIGAGEDYTVIDGRFRAPVFTLNLGWPAPKTVTLVGMTITHGSGSFGGGIGLNTPDVTSKITKSVVTHNRAQFGGGMAVGSEGSAIVTNCTVARNTAGQRGGGVWVQAPSHVDITGTSFTENISNQDGGGIFIEEGLPDGSISLTNSTLANNTAQRDVGGLINLGGVSGLKTVVVARNSAGRDGGGVAGRRVGLDDVFVIQYTAGADGGGTFGEFPASIHTSIADNHPNNCAGDGGMGCP